MKRIGIAGLCLAAMFVMNVVVTATASAAPTKPYWDQCSKTTTEKEGWWKDNLCKEPARTLEKQGEWEKVEIETEKKTCVLVQSEKQGAWEDNNCTKPNKQHRGEWAWVNQKHQLTGTSGAGKLETVGGSTVTCTADSQVGHFLGPKTVGGVVVTFTGCESGGFKCNTKGAPNKGEIITNSLNGEIGYIEKATQKVGLLLIPAGGKPFAEFECTVLVKLVVQGSIIGELTPVNKESKTFTLEYKQTKGVPSITKFEGGAKQVLETSKNGGKLEESGIETSDTITVEDGIQILA